MPSWGGDPSTMIGGMLLVIDTRAAYPVQTLLMEAAYPAFLDEAMSLVHDSHGDLVPLLITQY